MKTNNNQEVHYKYVTSEYQKDENGKIIGVSERVTNSVIVQDCPHHPMAIMRINQDSIKYEAFELLDKIIKSSDMDQSVKEAAQESIKRKKESHDINRLVEKHIDMTVFRLQDLWLDRKSNLFDLWKEVAIKNAAINNNPQDTADAVIERLNEKWG